MRRSQKKFMRINELFRKYTIGLGGFIELERLYLMNALHRSKETSGMSVMNGSPSESAASASLQVQTPSPSTSTSISRNEI
jgi:hypothetical protein